jgi:hypothetical protein
MQPPAFVYGEQSFDPGFPPPNAAWPTSFAINGTGIRLEDMPPYFPDPLYEEFMGRQPTLQWLDSHFDIGASAGSGEYFTPP